MGQKACAKHLSTHHVQNTSSGRTQKAIKKMKSTQTDNANKKSAYNGRGKRKMELYCKFLFEAFFFQQDGQMGKNATGSTDMQTQARASPPRQPGVPPSGSSQMARGSSQSAALCRGCPPAAAPPAAASTSARSQASGLVRLHPQKNGNYLDLFLAKKSPWEQQKSAAYN